MEHEKQPDKAVEKEPEFKKSREYRRFKKLQKQVIKAPPMRKKLSNNG